MNLYDTRPEKVIDVVDPKTNNALL